MNEPDSASPDESHDPVVDGRPADPGDGGLTAEQLDTISGGGEYRIWPASAGSYAVYDWSNKLVASFGTRGEAEAWIFSIVSTPSSLEG